MGKLRNGWLTICDEWEVHPTPESQRSHAGVVRDSGHELPGIELAALAADHERLAPLVWGGVGEDAGHATARDSELGLTQWQSGVDGEVAVGVVEPGTRVLESDREDGAGPAGQHAYWAGLPELRCIEDYDKV